MTRDTDLDRTGSQDDGTVNGFDRTAFEELVEAVSSDAGQERLKFRVTTHWTGRTRSETVIDHYEIGGKRIDRRFKVVADEPHALGGLDSGPNPQELLMSALNACMLIGYVTNAALKGISLHTLDIETTGQLDMRGFLGVSPDVRPGTQRIDYTVRIGGTGTDDQFCAIHQAVMARSPNYFDLSQPIRMTGRLEIVSRPE
jgi:uncharacterized OsmC-like protein